MKRIVRLDIAHLNLVNNENMRGVVRESARQDVRATVEPFIVTHNFGERPELTELRFAPLEISPDLVAGVMFVAPTVYATLIDRESWTENTATLRCTYDALVRIWFSARIEP